MNCEGMQYTGMQYTGISRPAVLHDPSEITFPFQLHSAACTLRGASQPPTFAGGVSIAHAGLEDALQPVVALDVARGALEREAEGSFLVASVSTVRVAVALVAEGAGGVALAAALQAAKGALVAGAEGRILVASIRAAGVSSHAEGGGAGALVASGAHELRQSGKGGGGGHG